MSTAIIAENLSKVYRLYDRPIDRLKESLHPLRRKYHRDFFALRDVSFEVTRGESIGVIGRNGSGKSTLLKIIAGILTPTGGSAHCAGTVSALLELGAGFNPEFTGIENIYFYGSIMGYSRREIEAKLDGILSFAGLGEFIKQPVKAYSSGMFVRLAFSLAISVNPDILLVDEALSVGDLSFQQRCLAKIEDLRKSKTTILLVTHDIMLTRNYCDRVLYMCGGSIKMLADPETAGELYIKDTVAERQEEVVPLPWEGSRAGFGSESGRIVAVQLTRNDTGTPTDLFHQDDWLHLTINATLQKKFTHPEICMQIRDYRGYVLYGITTDSAGTDTIRRSDCGDCWGLETELGFRMNLAPGHYSLTVALNDSPGDLLKTQIDKAVGVKAFTVLEDGQRFHGCINLKAEWKKY